LGNAILAEELALQRCAELADLNPITEQTIDLKRIFSNDDQEKAHLRYYPATPSMSGFEHPDH
jgi:hypothetical protein